MSNTASRALPWVALCVAALCGRMLWESHVALQAGEEALRRGDVAEGITRLRRAAHLYLPGSPPVRGAYDALERFGRESETRGQAERALVAWRAVRASALSTRWLVIPYEDRLRTANQHIAHLMAQREPAPDERDRSPQAREERHLALLREDRAPEAGWRVLLGIGLAMFLGALAHAARAGFDDDDRPRRGPLTAAAALGALGATLFLVSLWRA